MPKNSQTALEKNFVPRYLPWLIGGVMFVVYWLTINHWVNLLNLYQVSMVSGWSLQPQLSNPLTFLATLPCRWLPAKDIPIVLNIFSALCAAATLVVLARSVAILPHDRTEMERLRERSDFAYLTGWVAWIPPIAATIFAGMHLGFWENATSFTGESFELLWFAIILWQLLEYRMDEWEGRLYIAALMYGAGITENWAMTGFAPIFLMMLIWLRKLDFFNFGFLLRMIACSLAGLLFFFLLPLLATHAKPFPISFWPGLKFNLKSEWEVVKLVKFSDIRHGLGLISLTTLLPAFVMSIRWSSSFGDSSRLAATFVNYMMHVVNAVLLGVLLWVIFDPPFSPHGLVQQLGMNAPALTFYYIVALCIGYFCGYPLLIFGKQPVPTRRNPRPEPALPKSMLWLCPVMVVGALASVSLAAVLLIYKNVPVIHSINDNSLLNFARASTQNLPKDGAILLCDSDDSNQYQPVRAELIKAMLVRNGKLADYPIVDTRLLVSPAYHNYLHAHFPKVWPQTVSTNDITDLNPARVNAILNQLSKSNNLCYANPSFGYFFERFYQEPHGLIYAMKDLPTDTLIPPNLTSSLISENETFWNQALAESQQSIKNAQSPIDYSQQRGFFAWVLMRLHLPPESNPNALAVGMYYSKSLNFLGVEAQRAGYLKQAGDFFSHALDLNSNNVVASINLNFNRYLTTNSALVQNISPITTDQFGRYHSWNEVLNANGPFDEPSFAFENGCWLMLQGDLPRQATASFNRVRQLVPYSLPTRYLLAQVYIRANQPDQALEALHDPISSPKKFGLTSTNSIQLNMLMAAAHFQKDEVADAVALLDREIERHPADENLLAAVTRSYLIRGLYTNALKLIDHELAINPSNPKWLFGKGFACMKINKYDEAISAFGKILQTETNNPDALFNRAVAYLKTDKLAAAKADYGHLQSSYTNSFQIAYGLGEIAWREHDNPEALRNYKVYVANAPTNTSEFKMVHERVTQLGGK